MRVVVFFDSYNLGGAEKHGLKLADYFKNKRNFEVEVWVMEAGTEDDKCLRFCKERNIPTRIIGKITRLQRLLFWKQLRPFVPVFRDYHPDVIISFNNLPNLINGLVGSYTGVKCRMWSQQSVNDYPFTNWIDKKAFDGISCIVSNSHHALKKMALQIPIPAVKGFVVPNGIELEKAVYTPQQWHQKLGVGANDFKAVMMANLTNYKDHLTLVKAWKVVVTELAKQNRKAYLVLAGRYGNTAAKIAAAVMQEDIFPFVKLPGQIDDVAGLNNAMDLGLLSSPAEGMPNSLMENMLAGLPVAGTDIDGIKEVVGESNYRYLAPVGDWQALANCILTFANNPDLCKTVGQANRKRIEEDFSIEQMCLQTEVIINKYINQ